MWQRRVRGTSGRAPLRRRVVALIALALIALAGASVAALALLPRDGEPRPSGSIADRRPGAPGAVPAAAPPRPAAGPVRAVPEGSPHTSAARRAMARLARAGEAIRHGGGRQPLVALTFDDGPGPWTDEVLAELERLDVRATFYVQGHLADEGAARLRRIVAAGHELGVHGWSHVDLTTADDARVRMEIADTRDAVRRITGVDPLTMRPAYGAIDARVWRLLAPYRLPVVLWDIDTVDWAGRGAAAIRDEAIAGANAGSIVLMHDGGGDRTATVAALAPVVRDLRARRAEFVTVSQMLMRDPPRRASEPDAPEPDAPEPDAPAPT